MICALYSFLHRIAIPLPFASWGSSVLALFSMTAYLSEQGRVLLLSDVAVSMITAMSGEVTLSRVDAWRIFYFDLSSGHD